MVKANIKNMRKHIATHVWTLQTPVTSVSVARDASK